MDVSMAQSIKEKKMLAMFAVPGPESDPLKSMQIKNVANPSDMCLKPQHEGDRDRRTPGA